MVDPSYYVHSKHALFSIYFPGLVNNLGIALWSSSIFKYPVTISKAFGRIKATRKK